ncbi:hypothetical protein PQI07_36565 [Methylobacterium sp. 092160098-2]|uniref:hypothetical protein n=1 Tax=Methylobacterium sp. 092160098-2 TaxID=3025129 RepID=UPI002381A77E|nr:hypothetical protein [Methylobacterium sp. 092160098-2]MDE4916089.1 hypothetical protein [Methylobacterium sp. 092160098-2]
MGVVLAAAGLIASGVPAPFAASASESGVSWLMRTSQMRRAESNPGFSRPKPYIAAPIGKALS